jgi:hypothetical protein
LTGASVVVHIVNMLDAHAAATATLESPDTSSPSGCAASQGASSRLYRQWRCTSPACGRVTRDRAEVAAPCECEQLIDGREVLCGARFAPVALWCAVGQHHVFALAVESGQRGSCCPACEVDLVEPVTVKIPALTLRETADLWLAEQALRQGAC